MMNKPTSHHPRVDLGANYRRNAARIDTGRITFVASSAVFVLVSFHLGYPKTIGQLFVVQSVALFAFVNTVKRTRLRDAKLSYWLVLEVFHLGSLLANRFPLLTSDSHLQSIGIWISSSSLATVLPLLSAGGVSFLVVAAFDIPASKLSAPPATSSSQRLPLQLLFLAATGLWILSGLLFGTITVLLSGDYVTYAGVRGSNPLEGVTLLTASTAAVISSALPTPERKRVLRTIVPFSTVLFVLGLRGEVLFPAVAYVAMYLARHSGQNFGLAKPVMFGVAGAWSASIVFFSRLGVGTSVEPLDLFAELGGTLRVSVVASELLADGRTVGSPIGDHAETILNRLTNPLTGSAVSSVASSVQRSLPTGSSGVGGSPFAEAIALGGGWVSVGWIVAFASGVSLGLSLVRRRGLWIGAGAGLLLGLSVSIRNPTTIVLSHCLMGVAVWFFASKSEQIFSTLLRFSRAS